MFNTERFQQSDLKRRLKSACEAARASKNEILAAQLKPKAEPNADWKSDTELSGTAYPILPEQV